MFVLVCKCVLPPGDNPIAVNKYYYIIIIYLGHHVRVMPAQNTSSRLLFQQLFVESEVDTILC